MRKRRGMGRSRPCTTPPGHRSSIHRHGPAFVASDWTADSSTSRTNGANAGVGRAERVREPLGRGYEATTTPTCLFPLAGVQAALPHLVNPMTTWNHCSRIYSITRLGAAFTPVESSSSQFSSGDLGCGWSRSSPTWMSCNSLLRAYRVLMESSSDSWREKPRNYEKISLLENDNDLLFIGS